MTALAIDSAFLDQPASAIVVNVAGSSNVVLTIQQQNAFQLDFTGTITGDVQIIAPLIRGLRYELRNSTAGAQLLTFGYKTGDTIYLPPGMWIEAICDGTNYRTETRDVEIVQSISTVNSAGTYNTELFKLPPNFILTTAEIRSITAPFGGSTFVSLGTGSAGSTSIIKSLAPAPSNGVALGITTTDLGVDLSLTNPYDGKAPYPISQTIWFSQNQIVSSCVVGNIEVYLAGFAPAIVSSSLAYFCIGQMTENADTMVSSGTQIFNGTIAVTEGADTTAGIGTSSSSITGTASTTQAADTTAASGYTPPQLASQTLWLDAARADTVTVATGISQWSSIDGTGVSGHKFAQVTAADQPAYTASVINSLPASVANGTSDGLNSNGASLGNLVSAAAWTMFCVVSIQTYNRTEAGGGANGVELVDGIFNDASGYFGLMGSSSNSNEIVFNQYDGADRSIRVTGLATNTPYLVTVWFDGSNLHMQVAGTTATTVASGNIGNLTYTAFIQMGEAGTHPGANSLGEFMLWNVTLSAADISATQTYLRQKWNVT